MELLAQILGIIGLIVVIISFQQKEQKRLIGMQIYSSGIFALHFLLLGAITGSVLNIIAVVRAIVFSHKERPWAQWKGWPWVLIGAFFAVYLSNFLFLDMEPTAYNLLLELLPTVGIAASTVGFSMKKASHTRLTGLINSPAWLIYNAINGSIGGTLTEALSLISIITGIIRLDLKKKA